MTEYRRGRPGEEEAIIDFINLVFSHDHQPHDFPQLLPKLYSKENFHPEYHYLAVEDGRIRASIGSYPNTAVYPGHVIYSRDIGAVSVHPYSRRAGHMRKLMDMLLHDMEEEGAVISWLGGQRQRYGYWGYEHAGFVTNFDVNSANIRHTFPGEKVPWVLRELSPTSPDLATAQLLYEAYPFHYQRSAFYDTICNWNSRPWGFYDVAGNFRGYCVLGQEGGNLLELILADEGELKNAVMTVVQARGSFRLAVPSWQVDRARFLASFAEGYSLTGMEQCRIISFKKVLEAGMALQNASFPLVDLSFSFACPETGEALRLTWEKGIGSVEPCSTDACDVVLSRREATTLLFAPSPAFLPPAGLPTLLRANLPLWIAPTSCDCV